MTVTVIGGGVVLLLLFIMLSFVSFCIGLFATSYIYGYVELLQVIDKRPTKTNDQRPIKTTTTINKENEETKKKTWHCLNFYNHSQSTSPFSFFFPIFLFLLLRRTTDPKVQKVRTRCRVTVTQRHCKLVGHCRHNNPCYLK